MQTTIGCCSSDLPMARVHWAQVNVDSNASPDTVHRAPTLLEAAPCTSGHWPAVEASPSSSSPAPAISKRLGTCRVRAVLLGDAGVGKTALAGRILGHEKAPLPTMGVDFATRLVCLDDEAPLQLHLWDTSGQERFKSLADAHLRDMEEHDAIIAVYATSDAGSLEAACERVRQAQRCARGRPRLALVGAKADTEPRAVTAEAARAKAEELGAVLFVEVCCPAAAAASDGNDRSTMPPPSPPLATRRAVEQQLVRPLLRACLERMPSAAEAAHSKPSLTHRDGRAQTPPPPKAAARPASGLASLCRCLRFMA